MNRRRFSQAVATAVLGPMVPALAGADNRLDAEVLRVELDYRLDPGRAYKARILVRNTGNLRWDKGEFSVRFRNSEGPDGKPVEAEDFSFVALLSREVLPGETEEVNGTLVAPPQPGKWKLTAVVLHGKEPLGKAREEEAEVLAAYRARIESIRIESVIRPNKDTDIIVKLLNDGKSEWGTELTDFFVSVYRSSGSSTAYFRDDWDQHIALKQPVAPNGKLELRFKVRPRRAGTVTLQFSMWDRKRRDDFGEVERREIVVA